MKAAKTVKTYREIAERDYEERFLALMGAAGGDSWDVTLARVAETDTGSVDFRVTLRHPNVRDEVEFRVETKALPRPSRFRVGNHKDRSLAENAGKTVVPVLAAPFVSERVADLCKENGWSWFDLSGNCRIKVADVIYIERTGAKAIYKQPRPLANLGTAASARVLRALLAPRNAGRVWTQSALKAHCDGHDSKVSFGLVNKVVRHLHDQAWVRERDDGFSVSDPEGLLETWCEAYRFDRHRRVNFFTLLKPGELANRLQMLTSAEGEALYAAFSAADYQAPSVRQNKTWLYVNNAAIDPFMRFAEAKRVDSGENIVVLVPDDDGVFYLGEAGPGGRLACTNPVQTWLDLRHVGGRGEEAAEAILQQCLRPFWEGGKNA